MGHIEQVRVKVGRLLGVLGRAGAAIGGRVFLLTYNGLVLPQLQYCLMVWGNFQGNGNGAQGGALLGYQKRFAGLVAGKRRGYHSDPLFAQFGMLKVSDLYRQQLRIHAWRFWNKQLPANQAAMLNRASDVHRYPTRSAGSGLALMTRDHRSVGYRIPREWSTLTEAQRGTRGLSSFKKGSRGAFLAGYAGFECDGCWVCRDR